MSERASSASHSRTSDSEHVAFRRFLLIELSVLRRRYSRLCGHHQDDDDKRASIPSAAVRSATPLAYPAASVDEKAGALCQSDRDAIEALFHSMDDFTLEFNEGKGKVQRDDIISKITGHLA
ncbi:hypothetical protein JIQ42_03961 [Leishmania sp. Namibia]|uniref:hypothetical protein n=1 Tax=Leishmania sp. Namibia TaxID=2802991 RepID=UPI001B6AACE4|nr:hypothetical protein JIQ42_03961 [Leishmania sp. Namibia]